MVRFSISFSEGRQSAFVEGYQMPADTDDAARSMAGV